VRVIKSDFEVITKRVETTKDVKVYAVGDLHAGAISADLKGWERFNQMILEDPLAYVIFLGDMMNNATRSSVSNPYDDCMRPRDQKIYLKERLADLAKADKILAILPGNHENRSLKDADDSPMYDVAAKLDLEDIYRDNIALVKLVVGKDANADRQKHSNCYVILATHGDGAGRLTGGTVNRYEQFAANWNGVDIFYFGHSHKPFVTKPNKIVVDRLHANADQINTIVTTGASWMYYAGYPVRKLYNPAHKADPDQPITTVFSGKYRNWRIKVNW